jgi:hypothetical protein
MPLHLIAMLVNAAKEVGAAMNIEHDTIAFGDCQLFPRIVVLAHFDPFGFECCPFASPLFGCQPRSYASANVPNLPPVLPSNCFDTFWAQLRTEQFC